MTLTAREQLLLRQIARDLARDDPRLARLLSTPHHTRRAHRRRRRVTVLTLALALLAALVLGLDLAVTAPNEKPATTTEHRTGTGTHGISIPCHGGVTVPGVTVPGLPVSCLRSTLFSADGSLMTWA